MYKIKKKIHEQAIHISLFLAIDYVYLLYTCWVFFLQKQTQQLRQQLEGEIKNHESVKKVLQETRQQLEGTKEQVTLKEISVWIYAIDKKYNIIYN